MYLKLSILRLEKGMATHSSILAGKSNAQRSLVAYSSWHRKESDMTDQLEHTCNTHP